MYSLEPFKIDLNCLKEGKNEFHFELNDEFFEAIDAPEIRRGELSADITVDRRSETFELQFGIEGSVIVPCDICLDDMEQPIDAEGRLVAKFGEEYSEDDDLVTVAKDEGVLDVSWFIYEFIALDIPIKHVHAPGKCNRDMMKALEEHSANRSGVEDRQETIDPRWSGLLKLKDIKD
ncbi:MAG: YceD family protein [Prevotella sp.]